MKTPSELIKEKYPFYDNGKVTHDVELCGEQVEELMLMYADEVVKNNGDLGNVSDSFLKKFQNIIYGDLSDSEALNALHKLDNER